jgi:hypothetical protein
VVGGSLNLKKTKEDRTQKEKKKKNLQARIQKFG